MKSKKNALGLQEHFRNKINIQLSNLIHPVMDIFHFSFADII